MLFLKWKLFFCCCNDFVFIFCKKIIGMVGFIWYDLDDDYIVDDDSDIERDSRLDFINVFVGVI